MRMMTIHDKERRYWTTKPAERKKSIPAGRNITQIRTSVDVNRHSSHARGRKAWLA